MLICITSAGNNLDSAVDARFGRAANFIIYDTDTKEYQVVENSQQLNLPQGAGIQAATNVADTGAKALLTGNCGPKAFRVLSASGVEVYVGLGGMSITDAIARFSAGELQPISEANVEGHWA